MAEADSTVLMSDPGEWNALTHIQIAREQSLVALLTVITSCMVRVPPVTEQIQLDRY